MADNSEMNKFHDQNWEICICAILSLFCLQLQTARGMKRNLVLFKITHNTAIFSRFYKITISVNFLCGYQKMWRWLVFSHSILTDTAQKYNAHIQLSSHPAVALSSHSWNVCFFQAQGFYFSSFLTEWVILHVLPRRALQECHCSTWTVCLVILMKTREEKSLWLSWLKGLQMFKACFM